MYFATLASSHVLLYFLKSENSVGQRIFKDFHIFVKRGCVTLLDPSITVLPDI